MATHYTVESSIPGIKSWGWLPEHGELTKRLARAVVANFRRFKMRTRVTKTVTTKTIVKL
jgi:hypothetical protein